MKKIFFIALFLGFRSAFANEVIDVVDKSVVYVVAPINENDASLGTGFVVGKTGIVATNSHVIDGATEIFLLKKQKGEKPKPHRATVIWDSPDIDLAILSAPTLNAPPLLLLEGEPTKGAAVYAIGFPSAANKNFKPDQLESTATQGIVSRVIRSPWRGSTHPLEIVQHSASISRGNSGGPLIDLCGRVVGMNTQKTLGEIVGDSKQGFSVLQTDGIGYASNSSELIKALKSQGIVASTVSTPCSSGSEGNSIAKINGMNWILFGVLAALSLGIGALYLALRKPAFVRESYTQYIKRSTSKTDNKIPATTSLNWSLCGLSPNGVPINLKIKRSTLEKRSLIVGRDQNECDLVINDLSVSRRHASLSLVGERLMITDLKSTNGTFIEAIKIGAHPSVIRLGQKIIIGKVSLVLEGG